MTVIVVELIVIVSTVCRPLVELPDPLTRRRDADVVDSTDRPGEHDANSLTASARVRTRPGPLPSAAWKIAASVSAATFAA